MDWKGWIATTVAITGLLVSAFAYARAGGSADARVEMRLDAHDEKLKKVDDLERQVRDLPAQIKSIEEGQKNLTAAQKDLADSNKEAAKAIQDLNRDLREYFRQEALRRQK